MKKTMFKKVFAGIAAVFTLGLCVPTGFTGTDLKPSFEAVAEDEWLDMHGIKYKIKDRDTLIIKDSDRPGWSFIGDGFESYAADIKHLQIGNGWKINNFSYLTAIESLTIGDRCDIGEDAFYGCSALTSVKIGDKCRISAKAFDDCATLTSVEIGEGCTIEKWAFWECTSLTNVTIGNRCTVNMFAFDSCTSLTNVTIGDSCTIGIWAFDRCNSIQKVICIGDKNTVTVDDYNPEIICNKEKWITPSKCPKCSGWVIDFKCESCGYFDEAAAQAEIEKHEAEIDRIQKLIDENTNKESNNTASVIADGSVLAVIGGSTFLILCGLAAVIIVKRRKKTE